MTQRQEAAAFQDLIQGNHCFGCGPDNVMGLQIKSYWHGEQTLCEFSPQAHHCAGPQNVLNGGIIATVIDCHAICSAMAKAYQQAGRALGEGERIWFATGALEVSYLMPTPIDDAIKVIASFIDVSEKKIVLNCELYAGEQLCASADVVAVKVPNSWFD